MCIWCIFFWIAWNNTKVGCRLAGGHSNLQKLSWLPFQGNCSFRKLKFLQIQSIFPLSMYSCWLITVPLFCSQSGTDDNIFCLLPTSSVHDKYICLSRLGFSLNFTLQIHGALLGRERLRIQLWFNIGIWRKGMHSWKNQVSREWR